MLYAVNRDSPHHERARIWLESSLSGMAPLGLAWIVILGFLRLATRPGIFSQPLGLQEALDVIAGWVHHPGVILIHPGIRHWEVLRSLLEGAGTGGNLTTDAHLAALAVEFDAELHSADNDFARFRPVLSFVNPLG